jgi:hypothetical protein
MTKNELYILTTQLTSGIEIDLTVFDQFLDIAQSQIEDIRPWVILRGFDSSQTADSSNSFTTPKDLAVDFKEYCEESPIQLIDASNNVMGLNEIPFSDRFRYSTYAGKFCVDYANSNFYLTGTIPGAYAIYQNYIKIPALVSSGSEWVFPERFHKILAFMVAIYWRKGIDYDMFNQTLADNQGAVVRGIVDTMTRWDSNLQYSMQRGKDPFNSNTIGQGSTSGGQVQM